MPTFNRSNLIPETLRAIENQTYSSFECFIIDDGSTDNTERVIRNLNLDFRFKYFKRPDNYSKGPSACRNFGLDKALGNYIIFFDDDDIPHPDNLENCLESIKSGNYDYCRYLREVFYGDFHYDFDPSTDYSYFTINGKKGVLDLLSQKVPFNCCAVMWKRSCFKNIRFNENLIYAEEWECFHRILANGALGISIDKTLFYARKHINSSTGSSSDQNSRQYQSIIEAIKIVIINIAQKNLMDKKFVKFFAWESVRRKDKSIYDCLLLQNLSFKNWLIAYRTYYASPLIKLKINLEKRLKSV